ncbi:uncharacterized protein PgNI_12150 [Pyricularia grisea]|uniref:Uncharacterized protein n=1 Tax=Pyricularia grisea TaxID=148305 RepID=A0A6P8AQA8_PYRGI|nr:uncharacterized protein PgNI_12150 [Pyricularia grisea]TLD04236.1 hypothetical protein PgNI_12150 [Pyricularia grisea]
MGAYSREAFKDLKRWTLLVKVGKRHAKRTKAASKRRVRSKRRGGIRRPRRWPSLPFIKLSSLRNSGNPDNYWSLHLVANCVWVDVRPYHVLAMNLWLVAAYSDWCGQRTVRL